MIARAALIWCIAGAVVATHLLGLFLVLHIAGYAALGVFATALGCHLLSSAQDRRLERRLADVAVLERWNEAWDDEYAREGDAIAACEIADRAAREKIGAPIEECPQAACRAEKAGLQEELRRSVDFANQRDQDFADLKKRFDAMKPLEPLKHGIQILVPTETARVQSYDGVIDEPITLRHEEVWLSPDMLRALAYDLALRRQYAMPSMIITPPGGEPLEPAEAERLREQWKRRY